MAGRTQEGSACRSQAAASPRLPGKWQQCPWPPCPCAGLSPGHSLGFLLGPQTCPHSPCTQRPEKGRAGPLSLQDSGHRGAGLRGGPGISWGGVGVGGKGVPERESRAGRLCPQLGGGHAWRPGRTTGGSMARGAPHGPDSVQAAAQGRGSTQQRAVGPSPSARPPLPPSCTPRPPTCVSAARRGMEAARPWLSSPGWGSPSGPLRAMLCIWTSTAWGTAAPSHTQQIPLPPSLLPCLPHPIPSPFLSRPGPIPSPFLLTGFPGCTTGISVEWPRSRGALAACGTSWALWAPQETDSLRPPSGVCLWGTGCPVSSTAAGPAARQLSPIRMGREPEGTAACAGTPRGPSRRQGPRLGSVDGGQEPQSPTQGKPGPPAAKAARLAPKLEK